MADPTVIVITVLEGPASVETQVPGPTGAAGAGTAEALAAQAAAEAAQAAAETAQDGAETAETNAAASAAAALASKTAAETAETNAETAETNAETAETNAAASAAAALASKTAAETAETNAETAETNAEAAAAAASASETAAAASATAATASATSASTDADRAEAAAEAAEAIADFDPADYLDKVSYDTDNDGKVNQAEVADEVDWAGVNNTPTTLVGYGITDAATDAQGALADSAVQPADLGTAAAEDVGYFATAAQGALADTAVQPADLGTAAAENVGYFATAAQGTKADSAIQSITETGNGININVSVPTAPVLSLDATLEAVANFVTGANKVMYWTGTDTLSSFDTTAYTRGFMAAVDAAAARTALVLGTVATLNTGTGAGNIPILDGSGLLDTAILPALAITVPSVVGSQAAMLALTAQQGDVAIRTDLNKSFILSTNSPGTLADWKELLTPTDAVLSVAALTGAISAASLLTALGLSTSDSPQFTGLNIGHATDTTITRSSAGVLAVEGAIILTQTSPVANSPTLNNAITVESSANNSSTNFAIDLANGTLQVITLTGNWVPSTGWPTATAGQFFRLIIKQDGTGSRTITWPSSVKWPASTAPTITATASKADVIDFSSDGTNWFGVVVGQVYL